MNPSSVHYIAVIALSGVFVYSIRLLGLVFGDRLPKTGIFKRGMDALPGAIFAALVAPGILSAGWPGLAAGGAIFFVVRRTGNVLAAMILGVGIVAFMRWAGVQ